MIGMDVSYIFEIVFKRAVFFSSKVKARFQSNKFNKNKANIGDVQT